MDTPKTNKSGKAKIIIPSIIILLILAISAGAYIKNVYFNERAALERQMEKASQEGLMNVFGTQEAIDEVANKEATEEQTAAMDEILAQYEFPEVSEYIYDPESPEGPPVAYKDIYGKTVIFDIHEEAEPLSKEEFEASLWDIVKEAAEERGENLDGLNIP